MVGIPGKSKGCHTCRRRKIRVSLSRILSAGIPLLNGSSVLWRSRAACVVRKAGENVKDMNEVQYSLTKQLKDGRNVQDWTRHDHVKI